jgi:hypothetical protein
MKVEVRSSSIESRCISDEDENMCGCAHERSPPHDEALPFKIVDVQYQCNSIQSILTAGALPSIPSLYLPSIARVYNMSLLKLHKDKVFLSEMKEKVCCCQQPNSDDGVNCIVCLKVFANKMLDLLCQCVDIDFNRVEECSTCPKCGNVSLGEENKRKLAICHSEYMKLLHEYNGTWPEATLVNWW